MYVSGITDTGSVRTQNQDAIFHSREQVGPLPNLFIVADGMGGHNAGEVASSQTIEAFCDYIRNFPIAQLIQPEDYLDLLVTAAQHANEAVFSRAGDTESLTGMGTTLTACVIEDEKAIIVHVGDSRVYAIKPDSITQLTSDHTYVEEMITAGQLTPDDAKSHPKRHMLTRVLGTQAHLQVDGLVPSLADCTAILLCSDGLCNMLDDQSILEIVNRPGYVEQRTKALIDEANLKGGSDNISAILIDIGR